MFSRYVEIGRVCLINYGPDQGKLCTIIDVVDSNKALIDGPKDLTGVVRQMIPFKRLSLTDLVAKVRSSRAYARARAESALVLSCRVTLDAARRWFSAGRGVAVVRLQVPRNAPYKVLKAAWTDDDVMGKWEATSWAKKLAAKKKRANMGDFDRFKLMCARKQRSKAVKVRRDPRANEPSACCDLASPRRRPRSRNSLRKKARIPDLARARD